MELISQYFDNLTERQTRQIDALDALYREWNAKRNVISRRDIDNLYLHHVLHSMSIAKIIKFKPGTRILDFGCGGGFPGIPLAILFPECKFRLIDGTGKKIKVAEEIAKALELSNVAAVHRRGEEEKDKFDFVVSRAVMPLLDMVKIVRKNLVKTSQKNALPNGIITLKGGCLDEEIKPFHKIVTKTAISDFYADEWFKEKYIVYLPVY